MRFLFSRNAEPITNAVTYGQSELPSHIAVSCRMNACDVAMRTSYVSLESMLYSSCSLRPDATVKLEPFPGT